MTDPTRDAAARDTEGWTAPDTIYFWGGPLSNFAATPGLRLPYGYHGHHETGWVPVATVEHWFQACKATNRQDFDYVLAATSPAGAKAAGRRIALRSDWEQIKYHVMLCVLRGKFAVEPYRSALLLTHPHSLAENSPHDFTWGCRDRDGGYSGQNLLGRTLMEVRAELVADRRQHGRPHPHEHA